VLQKPPNLAWMNYVPSYVVTASVAEGHCKEVLFRSRLLQKVSNKEIACLVNRYMSDRGNLAINLKAK